jgi:methylenetetrahydrofolate reductase (NADPH)
MHITKFYEDNDFVLSIEIMPPRNGVDINKVLEGIKKLQIFDPKFVAVTQGTQMSLRGGSSALAHQIKSKLGIESVRHFTLVGKSKFVIENELTKLNYLEIQNIMALRGDLPWGEDKCKEKPDELKFAKDLVDEILRKNQGLYFKRKTDVDFEELDENSIYRNGIKTNFCVGVAGYPEGHKECKDKTLNVKYLKEKVDAGANIIFTQMFFNANLYFDFVNDCRAAGIVVPIVPGILPITFFGQIGFLEKVCDVTIPDEYKELITNNKNDKQKIMDYSVEFITKLCKELKSKGVPGLHMYTMNNFDASQKILENLHK